MPGRIDRGNAKAIADGRIGGAAPALAQDRRILRAGEIDDVLDGEEIAREFKFFDQRQFAVQHVAHRFGQAVRIVLGRIAPVRPLPGQHFELLLRRAVFRDRLSCGYSYCSSSRLNVQASATCRAAAIGMGPWREQPRHLLRRLEVPLGIGLQQQAGPGHRGLVADRGHHVLQRAALGRVVKHIIGGEDRQAVCARHGIERLDPGNVVAAIEIAGGNVAHGGEQRGEMGMAWAKESSKGAKAQREEENGSRRGREGSRDRREVPCAAGASTSCKAELTQRLRRKDDISAPSLSSAPSARTLLSFAPLRLCERPILRSETGPHCPRPQS